MLIPFYPCLRSPQRTGTAVSENRHHHYASLHLAWRATVDGRIGSRIGNLLDQPAGDIRLTRVVLTLLEGKVVWRDDALKGKVVRRNEARNGGEGFRHGL